MDSEPNLRMTALISCYNAHETYISKKRVEGGYVDPKQLVRMCHILHCQPNKTLQLP